MKFTPITERLPKLDTPVLMMVQYEGDDHVSITDSELWNDPCSTINPCWDMGSAQNYKVFSWAYMPKPKGENSYIIYHKWEYNEQEKSWDRPRTLVKG